MAWMRQVCGRLESRYRYSNKLVYNNFPWPNPTRRATRARGRKSASSSRCPRTASAAAWHEHAGRPLRPKFHAAGIAPRAQRTGSRRGEMLSPRTVPLRPRTGGTSFPALRTTHRAAPARHAANPRSTVTDRRNIAAPAPWSHARPAFAIGLICPHPACGHLLPSDGRRNLFCGTFSRGIRVAPTPG